MPPEWCATPTFGRGVPLDQNSVGESTTHPGRRPFRPLTRCLPRPVSPKRPNPLARLARRDGQGGETRISSTFSRTLLEAASPTPSSGYAMTAENATRNTYKESQRGTMELQVAVGSDPVLGLLSGLDVALVNGLWSGVGA